MSSQSAAEEGLLLSLKAEGWVTDTFLRLPAAKREGLIEAVLAEMVEVGPGGASIKEVAARAGLPVGSLYQYFRDRDAMVLAASRLVARNLAAELEACGGAMAELPLEEGLRSYLREALAWAQERPVLLTIFASAAYREAVPGPRRGRSSEAAPWIGELLPPVSEAILGLVRAALAGAARRGELADDGELEAKARIVNTLVIAACDALLLPGLNSYYRLYEVGAEPEERLEALLRFILAALGPADAGRKDN